MPAALTSSPRAVSRFWPNRMESWAATADRGIINNICGSSPRADFSGL
jgi:hypothetical protein